MTPPANTPHRIILDTDLGSDCDDAGALAVLHALADLGEADILACLYSSEKNPYGPGCLAAINSYYGRRAVPIGAARGDEVGDPRNDFAEPIARDTARYGHHSVTRDDVPDLVSVYRRALAAAPAHSVTIAAIGHPKGLHALLASPPCAYSPLGGSELVRRHVRELVVMAGCFPLETRPGWNFGACGAAPYSGPLLAAWPTPIVFSGYEVGINIVTGPSLQATPDANPVKEAYRLWENALAHGRASWDQTAILYAVRGPADSWDLRRGRCAADDAGRTHWTDDPQGPHAYLIPRRPPHELAALIGALMARLPEPFGRP